MARESSAVSAANDATTTQSRRRHLDLAARLGLKADSFAPVTRHPLARKLFYPIAKIFPIAPAPEPPRQILVVDDEELVIEFLDHHLSIAGYEVVRAVDGEAAMACIAKAVPDLIILAIMLPGMGGTEVLKRIRETPSSRNTPVIILSHRNGEADIVDALKDGASDYLTKPFMMGELLERVSKLITPFEHPMKSLLDELAEN